MITEEDYKRELDSPFVSGKIIHHLMTDVFGMPKSRTQRVYEQIRSLYIRDSEKRNAPVFRTSVPNKVFYDYMVGVGITKDDMLRKIEEVCHGVGEDR